MTERPKLLREWVGLRCRLLRPVNTGHGKIKAGRTVTVTSPHRRGCVSVSADHCSECGVAWHCSNVDTRDLEPLERVAPPKPASTRRTAAERGWR